MTLGRAALIVGGVAALGALPLLFPRQPDAIPLAEQRIELDTDPDEVFSN